MPTVEIVRFPGSDAFVDNQLVFKECLSTLVRSEGCIRPVLDLINSNPLRLIGSHLPALTTASRSRISVPATSSSVRPSQSTQAKGNVLNFCRTAWETYDHHMKLTKHESYPGLIDSLNLASSAPLDVQHVDFDEDAAVAFSSGVTEVAIVTPRSDIDLQEAQELLKTLREHTVAQEACHAVALGESRENNGTWFIVVGWDSVQSRLDAAGKDPFPEIIKRLHALAEIDLKHTKLSTRNRREGSYDRYP
ncbi:hypothetical protein C0991_006196 [Blastosporella zonata]|nr:hypothetical protein C0991_006196 [Blastosporella zonata]